MSSSLDDSLQQHLASRVRAGLGTVSLDEVLPSSAGDFFSNDYLSLSTDAVLREHFLRKALAAPRLLGSSGSRISTGNSEEQNALEQRLQRFFGFPSALLFPSAFIANTSFFSTVPRKDDVIVYDELTHASCREGFRSSAARGATYRFAHNSLASLEDCIRNVLCKHPQITQGNSTVFVSLESLYSMEGDFCPLVEMVQVIENLIPAGHAHIVVDEAHTSALCGPNGSGYIPLLLLNDRIHTVVHAFGKGWGFRGGVILSSPKVREYLIHSVGPIIYSTALPHTDIIGIQSCLDIISGERGEELRQRLNVLCRYAHKQLLSALKRIPDGILSVENLSSNTVVTRDLGLCSPIIPIYTPLANSLSDYLKLKGYSATATMYPIVKIPRVRMSVHVSNKEEDIDSFIDIIVEWGTKQVQGGVPPVVKTRL
ncbi:8-amino-7-oxononanoate synthase [Paxillus ammoniavirescens]|nr:8-amino-7-oxononanoate synthase [Paxillus ammoniavirescens]